MIGSPPIWLRSYFIPSRPLRRASVVGDSRMKKNTSGQNASSVHFKDFIKIPAALTLFAEYSFVPGVVALTYRALQYKGKICLHRNFERFIIPDQLKDIYYHVGMATRACRHRRCLLWHPATSSTLAQCPLYGAWGCFSGIKGSIINNFSHFSSVKTQYIRINMKIYTPSVYSLNQ